MFKNKKDVKEIMVANKSSIPVKNRGDIKIKTIVNDQRLDVVIRNVYYVPGITTNLLSVSQMIVNGNRVVFEKNICKVFNNIEMN